MTVALGLGARASATTEAVLACVAHARAAVCSRDLQIAALAATARSGDRGYSGAISLNAPSRLAGHASLIEAAQRLGLALIWRDDAALAAVAALCVTQSPRVRALYGVGSVAEAAALAGAGQGARIVLARFSQGGVTCAAARGRA